MTYDDLKALIERRGVHAEFGAAGEGWAIEQNPHELATFLVAMLSLGVQSVLEIGTGYKGGLSRFLAAELGWRVMSVDVEDYGHSFAGVEYIVIDKEWANVEYIHFLEKFDLVFIDANHAYDAVKFDYEYYGKYATKAIAFHDIAGLRGCEGVQKFWSDVVWNYPNYSVGIAHIIIDDSERKAGIGWLVL